MKKCIVFKARTLLFTGGNFSIGRRRNGAEATAAVYFFKVIQVSS